MTDRVIVKGWRGRQEQFRAELRTRLWVDAAVVSLKYDDAFEFGGVTMRFDQEVQEQLRRLRYQAEWQRRKDDEAYRERHREWHAAWCARPENKAKLAAWSAAYAKANPERARERQARYRSTRREQMAIYNQLLRLSKRD